MANKQLDKTLKVDNIDYDINAVAASKVDNALTIELNNQSLSDKTIIFDGSETKTISIVPATGGEFTGPIAIPNAKKTANEPFDDKDVLNYYDIKNNILGYLINHSILYNCSTTGELTTTGGNSENSVKSISLIYGREADLNKYKNNTNSLVLPCYLYICSDTKNLFFGTNKDFVTPITPKASGLTQKVSIQTNLSSTTTASFDGTETGTIKPGITGILSVSNGGTGKTTLSNITVGKATTLATPRTVQTKLDSTASSSFDGSANITPGITGILSVAHGGTGTNSLSTVTVGSANTANMATKIKVVNSNGSSEATGNTITISAAAPAATSGNNNDIWIKI